MWAVILRSEARWLRNTTCKHLNTVEWLDKQCWLYSLKVKVLESEVCFHNTSSFDSGSQHILLGGYISPMGYPVQVIQVTLGREKSHQKNRRNKTEICMATIENRSFSAVPHYFLYVFQCRLTMLQSRWAGTRGNGWSMPELLRLSTAAGWPRRVRLSWSLLLLNLPARTIAVHHPIGTKPV